MHYLQRLAGQMRSAIEKYNMIQPNDSIMVGVSGGKDSVALLAGLSSLRSYYPKPFSLKAVTLDPCFDGVETDYSPIAQLCDSLEVDYQIERVPLGELLFGEQKQQNPCSLCARIRRGVLHNASLAADCNKIALGHHFDDAVETFFLNLLNGGRIGCFSPVTFLDRKKITLIRPLVFVEERDVSAAVRQEGLPIVKSRCPVDGCTARQDIKLLIRSLEKDYKHLRTKVLGAMQRSGLDGW